MHRPRSINLIYRYYLAAVLWWMKFILLSAAFVLMLGGFCVDDTYLVNIGAGAAFSGVFLAILQLLVANRARCPLCLTPVLASKTCSKHRKAKTLFGSYRARVSLFIIFKKQFHCPYCNEPTQLRLKNSAR